VLRRPVEPGQFVSLAFGQKARAAGIAQSMGSKGDCYDNAVAESFFATLKKELINRRSWPTRAGLRSEVFDYITRQRPGASRLTETCPRKPGNSTRRRQMLLIHCSIVAIHSAE
jgi:hypothetical protein